MRAGASSNLNLFLYGTIWYSFTALSNIYSKKYLVTGSPITLSLFSFSFGVITYALFYARKRLRQSIYLFFSYTPLAILHLGNVLFTNKSYKNSNVRFTYTIKAIEPLVTAIICWVLYSEKINIKLLFTLIPVPIGIFITSYSDMEGNYSALLIALLSVIISAARTVTFKNHGKKFAQNAGETLEQVKNHYS
jgi:drug/metabolite transporter (DMT)-like permease